MSQARARDERGPGARPSTRVRRYLLALAALGVAAAACADDPTVLPDNFNTAKSAGEIVVQPTVKLEGGTAIVRPLSGMHGAPLSPVMGDGDLLVRYWGRPAGTGSAGVSCQSSDICTFPEVCEGQRCRPPDGAHVDFVRIGADVDCRLSVEQIFPDPTAEPTLASSYDFRVLDDHIEKAFETNTAALMFQAAFNPGQACTGQGGVQLGEALVDDDQRTLLLDVTRGIVAHIRGDQSGLPDFTDTSLQVPLAYVEFLDDPLERMGYSLEGEGLEALFDAYAEFASGLVAFFGGQDAPRVKVGGLSFTLRSASELDYTSDADKHPLLRFIDAAATNTAPLHFLTFKTVTADPFEVLRIAATLRDYLDTSSSSAAHADTDLFLTGIGIDWDDPEILQSGIADEPTRRSAFVAAFQAAARIYLQDVPVAHAVAGRGPRVYADLDDHAGEDPASLAGLVVDSEYFEADGTPKPAFMGLFPFRQVDGYQRVRVDTGDDAKGFAILAAHSPSSDEVLHVLIANANVYCPDAVAEAPCSNAWVSYDLKLDNYVPATLDRVGYKWAVIDHESYGSGSFFFRDTGTVETIEGTGTVRFSRQMAVPSIHYIQFDRRP